MCASQKQVRTWVARPEERRAWSLRFATPFAPLRDVPPNPLENRAKGVNRTMKEAALMRPAARNHPGQIRVRSRGGEPKPDIRVEIFGGAGRLNASSGLLRQSFSPALQIPCALRLREPRHHIPDFDRFRSLPKQPHPEGGRWDDGGWVELGRWADSGSVLLSQAKPFQGIGWSLLPSRMFRRLTDTLSNAACVP